MSSTTVQNAFRIARTPSSPGGRTVNKAELQAIVSDAAEGGMSTAEKMAIAAGSKASDLTAPAKAELARLAFKYGFARMVDRLTEIAPRSTGSSGGGRGGSVGGSSSGGVGGGS